jgi:hypothetical protein
MRLAMILAALPLAACGSMASGSDSGTKAKASGSGTTRNFAVDDFTNVDLRGSDDVVVTAGAAFAVRAEGPSEELDRLEIKKDGSTLRVGRVHSNGISWGSRKGVKIYVTMPHIAGASVAGSGDMTVDRAGGDFDGAVAGSGDLTIGALQAGKATFSIAGSGGIAAAGSAKSLEISIAGSGDVDAGKVKAGSAEVSIAGSGNATADVTGPVQVSIMGSGNASMGAGAKCSTTKMGSGEARCG